MSLDIIKKLVHDAKRNPTEKQYYELRDIEGIDCEIKLRIASDSDLIT